MIEPEKAPVTPRVLWPGTGDAVPIDEVFHRMEGKPAGAIEIVGDFGSGKTTALRHLVAEAPTDREIVWVDDAKPEEVTSRMRECWVVYTSTAHMAPITGSSFRLVGWGGDERIEYLLAYHHDRCQSVIVRLGESNDRSVIGDSPMLWRIVLDEMAEDESIRSVDEAIWQRLTGVFPEGKQRRLAEETSCAECALQQRLAEQILRRLQRLCDSETLYLLRDQHIQLLLATEYLVHWLENPRRGSLLLRSRRSLGEIVAIKRQATEIEREPLSLPYALVYSTAERVADSPTAIACLREIVSKDYSYLQPMAASVLHGTDTGWMPEKRPGFCLDTAQLPRAAWAGIDLSDMSINLANLNGSDLARARLDRAQARATQFRESSLMEASLVRIWARNAYFTGADLSLADLQEAELRYAHLRDAVLHEAKLDRANLRSTDLRGASFVGASLRQARFAEADITGSDFSSANLEEAELHGLDLRDAIFDEATLAGGDLEQGNLEGMRLTGVDFTNAKLSLALLSDSVMVGCTMRGAKLKCAGLADIQWEGADLRDADLRGAVFHLGSSRSGLVDSPLASEGTRTGFYTDEFDEQSYQAAEEIRKANLCGADLRGAKIDGVDFYLVDLRGAKYDGEQLEHFRQCRAILDERT